MLQDGIQLLDGSIATNLQIEYGTTFPVTGVNIGELFYKTDGISAKIWVYDGTDWVAAATGSGASPSSITAGLGIAVSGSIVYTNLGAGTGIVLTNPTGTVQQIDVDLSALLPSQSGNSGKYLTTNGSSISWDSIPSTMASLTVTGQTDLATTSGTLTYGGTEVGFRNLPRTTTFNSTARGKRVAISAGITIPATTYSDSVAVAVGDTISVYNDSAANVSLTIGTGLTAYKDGNATSVGAGGTVTLAARGSCVIWYNTTAQVVIGGAVS